MLIRLIPVLLLLFACGARAAEPELLEPEKAFRFSARLIDSGQVEVRYDIAPGYYMYREKFKFEASPCNYIKLSRAFAIVTTSICLAVTDKMTNLARKLRLDK